MARTLLLGPFSSRYGAPMFVVVDGTHIAAWAKTRDETKNGDVEGATWGKHEGSFYGYKVFLVVDAASELPVSIVMATGKRNDTVAFDPLIEEFDERYDADELQAALSNAGFDSLDNREFCQEQLDCPLLTAINPRRSSSPKQIRDDTKQLFKEPEEEFDSSYDALEALPQQLLSDYGVEVGSVEETYIFQAIKERMHRHLRAGVERVFSRLKSFTGLDRIRTRKEDNVETHVVLSAVSPVAVSLTAKRKNKPGPMRSPALAECFDKHGQLEDFLFTQFIDEGLDLVGGEGPSETGHRLDDFAGPLCGLL